MKKVTLEDLHFRIADNAAQIKVLCHEALGRYLFLPPDIGMAASLLKSVATTNFATAQDCRNCAIARMVAAFHGGNMIGWAIRLKTEHYHGSNRVWAFTDRTFRKIGIATTLGKLLS